MCIHGENRHFSHDFTWKVPSDPMKLIRNSTSTTSLTTKTSCSDEDARLRPISTSANFDFGQLAEIEIGRSRNWPKSKLAEVEINWPKPNRWCLLCFFSLSFFFFLLLCFYFSLLFSCSYLSSFCFCACFRPQKPELNPKPQTLHPISDGPFRGTTLRRTTLRPTAQNFALFFSLPPQFSFSLLGVLSLNFVGVFEGGNPEMCTFGLSGCRVKPRRPHQTGPPGLAHDSPRTPNVHISGPRRFKHHKNSTKRPQEREKEARKLWRRREKKARKFGPPTLRGSTLLGPTLLGPTFSRFGASTLWAPHPWGPTFFFWVWASTLLGSTLRGPTFSRFGASTLWFPPFEGPTLCRPKNST